MVDWSNLIKVLKKMKPKIIFRMTISDWSTMQRLRPRVFPRHNWLGCEKQRITKKSSLSCTMINAPAQDNFGKQEFELETETVREHVAQSNTLIVHSTAFILPQEHLLTCDYRENYPWSLLSLRQNTTTRQIVGETRRNTGSKVNTFKVYNSNTHC